MGEGDGGMGKGRSGGEEPLTKFIGYYADPCFMKPGTRSSYIGFIKSVDSRCVN